MDSKMKRNRLYVLLVISIAVFAWLACTYFNIVMQKESRNTEELKEVRDFCLDNNYLDGFFDENNFYCGMKIQGSLYFDRIVKAEEGSYKIVRD